MKISRLVAPALTLLVVLGACSFADAQCAMCRNFLTSSPEGRRMASAFGHGILLMLAAPYLVMGTFAAVFFRQRWQPPLFRFLGRVLRVS
jgi:hypothetical protein